MSRVFSPAAQAAADRIGPLDLLSAAQLQNMAFPEPRWVIPNLVPEGLTLLAGKPKIGKSWLCLGMGISVASGGVALGEISVDAGDVLYLALEDNRRRIQDRMHRLTDFSEDWPERLFFQTLQDAGHWGMHNGGMEMLSNYLTAHPETRLVMIDTFKRVRPPKVGNGNDYERDYEDMTTLQQIASAHGAGIVVVHHTRKAGAEDIFDEISGTSGLTGGADTNLVLTRSRGEEDAVLHVTGRDVEEQEIALRKDVGTQQWKILGDAHEVQMSGTRKAILEEVRSSKGPITPKQVADATSKNASTVRTIMTKMADDGDLVNHDGKYGLKEV